MSLKSFVTNVWKKLLSSVKKTYKKVDELANKLCPVAIDVVEAMKKINLAYRDWETDRKSTRLNSSHRSLSRMPSSA